MSRPRIRCYGRRAVVRVCSWVWMVVRFVCVIRVPVCARVYRVAGAAPAGRRRGAWRGVVVVSELPDRIHRKT